MRRNTQLLNGVITSKIAHGFKHPLNLKFLISTPKKFRKEKKLRPPDAFRLRGSAEPNAHSPREAGLPRTRISRPFATHKKKVTKTFAFFPAQSRHLHATFTTT
jgi:hypothetical protein